MSNDDREQPRDTRFAAGLPARVHYRGVDYPCRAHDLSRSGALLRGGIPWPSELEVGFALLSGTGDLELELQGRVARIEEDPSDEGTVLAIEFVNLSPEQTDGLERLLSRVIEGHAPAIDAVRPGTPPHEIRKVLEAIPLPHRVTLAARANPREREVLRHDIHPTVLESLARNPGLLVSEARALASSPHLMSTTLEILAADPRWQRDDEVRIAIAANPRVVAPLAEKVIASLGTLALRRLLASPSLNDELRVKILRRIVRHG